ncbi:MAG: transporter ATPase [Frankiales bacterium]|nr:transporter ATPase [Frankiales bacterium]
MGAFTSRGTDIETDGDLVRLAGVSFRRDETTILRDIDLTVGAGERWALLGRNGCGKTTLLSLVGALQHPTTGTVEVLGRTLGRVDIFRELWPRLGHVQGRHRPSGPLTALQVVLTGITGTNSLVLRWQPTGQELTRAHDSLRDVGVDELAGRSWELLSNGEQRRTLLARALVKAPDLLLLDEPAAGLDLPAREHLVDALDDLAGRRPELGSVLVTHHLEEIPASTTHVALMHRGRLLAQGPVAQVLAAEPLSACFELPLEVRHHDGRWTARSRR